ncbi:hypothetical protein GCM10020369_65400 [Cryptosporangium minutisporangium]|uniref:Excalibur calcium-binding domain-containing protein n=1 Tax=Cryptosporangium minutisporangium TaxID=113569 RepID=A0ABP6T979_9ACTN
MLIGLGGVIVLFCGLCGVAGVIDSGTDPAPSASVAAATQSPSAAVPSATTESPSPSPSGTTGAPLVGDEVIGSESSADADADVDRQPASDAAPTTRRAVPAPARTTSAPKPAPAKTTSGSNSGSVYYKNCTAVRAAGADPIRVGDPGYAKHLDRDGDGVGCE